MIRLYEIYNGKINHENLNALENQWGFCQEWSNQ